MKITPTPCCALGCLHGISNETTVSDLAIQIGRLKRDAMKPCDPSTPGGHRAIFCVTTPTERELMRKLIDLEFKEVYEFDRREGYPAGKLTMWMMSW